jgi:hypothetical protein
VGAGGVFGILCQAQEGQGVFDVGGFQEFQAAVFDEGDVAARELDFEGVGMVGGSEEDSLFFEVDAGFEAL